MPQLQIDPSEGKEYYHDNRDNSFSSSSSSSEYPYYKTKYPKQECDTNGVFTGSNPANFKSSWMVYMAVFCAQMSSICMGSAFGWSGPALDDMKTHPNSSINLISDHMNTGFDEDAKSWIASSVTVGAFVGAFFCGFLMDFFGRRKTFLLLGVPYTLGWGLITIAWSLWPILIGRFLTGLAVGVTTAVVPTYIAEISTPNNRGLLGMTFNFFVVGGMFYIDTVYVFDVRWYHMSMAVFLPLIIFIVTMFFMPESPTWAINKIEDSTESIEVARNALKRLRTSDSDQQGELNELIQGAVRTNAAGDSNLKFAFSTLGRRDVYIPMTIGAVLLFFQQFCGINAVQFYLPKVIESAGSPIDVKYAVLVSNFFMLMATIVGSAIIERFGRRILYIASAIGLMLSIGGLGAHIMINGEDSNSSTTNQSLTTTPITPPVSFIVNNSAAYFYAPQEFAGVPQINNELFANTSPKHTQTTVSATEAPKKAKSTSILPLICVAFFGVSFSMGVGPICWIIITEITPPQTIGLIVSTSSAFAWIFTFTVVRFTSTLQNNIGYSETYFLFAGFSLLSAIFIYFLPETKGKTNEELCRIFKYDQ